jgi:hypothetical protein
LPADNLTALNDIEAHGETGMMDIRFRDKNRVAEGADIAEPPTIDGTIVGDTSVGSSAVEFRSSASARAIDTICAAARQGLASAFAVTVELREYLVGFRDAKPRPVAASRSSRHSDVLRHC